MLLNHPVVATLLCAVAAAVSFTPLVIRLARRMDWLAYPKADRWHSEPTALMGGIGIYAAATLAVLLFMRSPELLIVWAGASVMFVTGLVDDLKQIRPVTKLLAQIVAAGILTFAGFLFGPHWPIWISMPLTFFWVIGITNAINLLDNMDGLAAGVAAIAAAVLALFSLSVGDAANAQVGFAVAGAAVGFLVFNFKPAKIFMGDSGSLFLGYVVAALALKMQADAVSPDGLGVYFVSLAVLAVPIFDTTLVTVMRTYMGRQVSQGGRDHSSHRLVMLGLSERNAVLTLYGVSFLFGMLALVFRFADVRTFYIISLYLAMGLVVFWVYLARMNVYKDASEGTPNRMHRWVFPLLHVIGGRNWKFVLGLMADLVLVTSAFVLAFELRFEQGMTERHEAFILSALPIILAVKLGTFYLMGLYKAIWRFAGTPEIVRLAGASAIGSAVSFVILGFLYGFGSLSKGVFVIDWMIVTISIAGIRLAFRGMRQYFASRRVDGRRVLLYGAGSAGQLAVRELRQNTDLNILPVAFLDDDVRKKYRVLHGMPVLGSLDDLENVCKEISINEVIITSSRMPARRCAEIADACAQLSLGCRFFRVGIQDISGGDSFSGMPEVAIPQLTAPAKAKKET